MIVLIIWPLRQLYKLFFEPFVAQQMWWGSDWLYAFLPTDQVCVFLTDLSATFYIFQPYSERVIWFIFMPSAHNLLN